MKTVPGAPARDRAAARQQTLRQTAARLPSQTREAPEGPIAESGLPQELTLTINMT
jgi:hypothetical protein